jgi:predicted tellurium resistance membrane protein TerC
MASHVEVMITAVVISVLFMLWFSGPVSRFVEKHPTIKMLALSFLILIGCNLVADAMGQHIPKGYTYFAMAFSVLVEMLNIKLRKHSKPVHLHDAVVESKKKS